MLLFTGLVFVVWLIAWWVRKTFYFWDDKNVVHHTFWQYLRFCFDIYTKPLHEVLIRNYKEHGRIYGSYQGTMPILVVGDTDILRDVMVSKFKNFSERAEAQQIGSDAWRNSIFTLSGAQWKKARTIFTPAMTTIRMKATVNKIKTIAERMASRIQEEAMQNKSSNMTELFHRASVDATAVLNYSVDLNSLDGDDHPLLKCIDGLLMSTAGWKVLMLFMTPCVYKILQPGFLNKSSTGMFKAFVSQLIDERKSKNKKEDDFLQLFMDADYEWENSEEKQKQTAQKRKMTLDEITAQGILFFIAGVEAASLTLAMTAYYLALHPQLQGRVLAEIDKALVQGEVTYDALQEMPYLEAAIKETMRLNTPDSVIMRLCTEETTVSGIDFKPGMGVDIPFSAIHRDPEYFPEPEKFRPERFLPENKDSVKSLSFLAFGAGPRNCVGLRVGMMQVKATLACLLRRVRLETCPETMVPMRYKPRQLLLVTDGPVILRPIARLTS